MTLPATPNLGLLTPEPSVTTGPEWAQMINDALNVIDDHDHTSGKGKLVPTAGLNINADLDFQDNDATSLRSTRYQLGTSVLAESADKGCVYVKDGNLHYNNSAGASVQITSGTSVVSSVTGAFTATTPGAYPYTVSAGDAQRILLVDTTSARTVNLPLATTALLFAIKDVSGQAWTNNISVVPNGTNTIDGVNATRKLNDNFGWTFFISDGVSNWSIGIIRDTVVPAGTVSQFAGATVPAGYLLCDGSVVVQATYPALFSAIGSTWNTGAEGGGNFRLPNMVGRFPLGKSASGTGSTLGGTGGALDHTHTVPAHHHAMGSGADLNITASGSHTHTFNTPSPCNLPGTANAYQGGTQTADNVINASTHTHPSGNIAGRIGLVTGGVNGNASMTSGLNNPAFATFNYIIKT